MVLLGVLVAVPVWVGVPVLVPERLDVRVGVPVLVPVWLGVLVEVPV